MKLPQIIIKATNVELGEQLENQIAQRLAPLTRVFRDEDPALEVHIRKAATEFGSTIHFVSLRLQVGSQSYTAVAAKPYLNRALGAASDMLRRTASRGASVSPYQQASKQLKDSYTLTL